MLYVIWGDGGPSADNDGVKAAIMRATGCVNRNQPPDPVPGVAIVDVDFHPPGSPIPVDFEGMRKQTFSKKDKELAIEIAVPPLRAGTEDTFVWAALVRAIDMAEEFFRARSLDWSVEHLRTTLRQAADCFGVPALDDVPALATETAGRPAETMLSVQLPTLGRAPTEADVVLRQELEQAIDDALQAQHRGVVDGGDIGSGMMGIYVLVSEPEAIDTVLDVLRQSEQLAHATVVQRSYVAGADEEEQYAVLWPPDYVSDEPAADLFSGITRRAF
jgi:hypothetical protein